MLAGQDRVESQHYVSITPSLEKHKQHVLLLSGATHLQTNRQTVMWVQENAVPLSLVHRITLKT